MLLDRQERRYGAVGRRDVAALRAHGRRAVAHAARVAEEVRQAGNDCVARGRVVDGERARMAAVDGIFVPFCVMAGAVAGRGRSRLRPYIVRLIVPAISTDRGGWRCDSRFAHVVSIAATSSASMNRVSVTAMPWRANAGASVSRT